MSLFQICERCQSREHEWTVREARIAIGELWSNPHLCERCTRVVTDAIRNVLWGSIRQPAAVSASSERPQEPK